VVPWLVFRPGKTLAGEEPMYLTHPELRKGLAEEHIRRLAEDMRAASGSGVERVVDETVGELVVLPPNGRVRDGAKVAREAGCLERKTA
jgi:hypothetical protein